MPSKASNPFNPPLVASKVTGGARSSYRLEVQPLSAFVEGESIEFSRSLGSQVHVNFSESYLTMRVAIQEVASGTASDVEAGDAVGLARFAPVQYFSKITTSFNGQSVDEIQHPSQAALAIMLSTRSKSWLNSYGSAHVAQESAADRQSLIVGGKVPELVMSIPSALWGLQELVRPGDLHVKMDAHPSWAYRMVETAVGSTALTLTTDYTITVSDVKLNLSCYVPEDGLPLAKTRLLELNSVETKFVSLASATSSSTHFGLSGPCYKAIAFAQTTGAGTNTTLPLHEAANASITAISTDYDSMGRSPATAYNLSFSTGRAQTAYQDFLAATTSDMDPSGCALDYDDWADQSTLFAWKLWSNSEAPGSIQLDVTFGSSFTGNMWLVVISRRWLVLTYNSQGVIEEVKHIRNLSELQKAV